MSEENKIDYEKTSEFAAILSISEIGLGAFAHALKLPFTGHTLSLNQAFILTFAKLKLSGSNHRYSSFLISNTTALLKSLAPAGKKLTPMLAISAQGNIHGIITLIFGASKISLVLANICLSLWAFIQPILIYFLLFGEDLLFMTKYFVEKFSAITTVSSENILFILFAVILIKIILAIAISFIAFQISDEKFQSYIGKLKKNKRDLKPQKSVAKGVIKDLTSPLFMFSFILMGLFYYHVNSNLSKTIWALARPLAIAIIIFYVIRKVPLQWLVTSLERKKMHSLAIVLEKTIQRLKSF